jgi:hypothetical protein
MGSTSIVTDPEGNECDWTGCGFNSISPNQFFGGCTSTGGAGTLCCSGAATTHYYVNAATGSDSNDGLAPIVGGGHGPFKTITKAVSVATTSGQTINVAPGSYVAGAVGVGETFPINVPAGVNLIGDEASSGTAGNGTRIVGCGTIAGFSGAVGVAAGAVIAGFTVTCPSGSGVIVTGSNANIAVRNNTLINNGDTGVFVTAPTGVALNTSTSNFVGLRYINTVTGGKAENNTLTGNSYGVVYNTNGANMGDVSTPTNSVGNNILSCNTNSDFWVQISTLSIQAAANRWDHGPPNLSPTTSSGGMDLFYNGAGVTYGTLNLVVPNPCLACSASAGTPQVFTSFMDGCPGSVTFATSITSSPLCATGCHACTASEWVTNHGPFPGIAPTSSYWTGDNVLTFSSGPDGNCSITTGSPPSNCGANTSWFICPASGHGPSCNFYGCGFNTFQNQYIGGCAFNGVGQTQGTLCCCPP